MGAVVLLSGGAAAATAASAGHSSGPSGLTGPILHGCANAKTGAVNLVLKAGGHCPKRTRTVYWNSALFGSKTNHATAGSGGAACSVGQIILTAGTTAAAGTLPADGQTLSIKTYSPLFVLIGTQFGGNGKTTFDLPNLRNAAPDGLSYSICAFGTYP